MNTRNLISAGLLLLGSLSMSAQSAPMNIPQQPSIPGYIAPAAPIIPPVLMHDDPTAGVKNGTYPPDGIEYWGDDPNKPSVDAKVDDIQTYMPATVSIANIKSGHTDLSQQQYLSKVMPGRSVVTIGFNTGDQDWYEPIHPDLHTQYVCNHGAVIHMHTYAVFYFTSDVYHVNANFRGCRFVGGHTAFYYDKDGTHKKKAYSYYDKFNHPLDWVFDATKGKKNGK